jgi:hypothetical protein
VRCDRLCKDKTVKCWEAMLDHMTAHRWVLSTMERKF